MALQKKTMVTAIAGAGGVATYFLFQEVDKHLPSFVPQLGAWGKPSTLLGLGIGGALTALGLYGRYKGGGPLRGDRADYALAFGIPTLAGGVISGLFGGAPSTSAQGLGVVTVQPGYENVGSPAPILQPSEYINREAETLAPPNTFAYQGVPQGQFYVPGM